MARQKGVIAAGHELTVQAAEEILLDGGNAFDAIVAAHLAACVVEPVLTSLAGGGFLLAKRSGFKNVIYDFFAQTPCQRNSSGDAELFPISAKFSEATQEFHIGMGSFATPGTVAGIFAIHRDLCTMPVKRLAEPAIRMARNGVAINPFQFHLFEIVRSIYHAYPDTRKCYFQAGSDSYLFDVGDTYRQTELADILELIAIEGEDLFYRGEISDIVDRMNRERGGHITRNDFACYNVIKREPLRFQWRDTEISINPAPASGGPLIAFALSLLESVQQNRSLFGSSESLMTLARIQQMTDLARMDTLKIVAPENQAEKLLEPGYLARWRQKLSRTIQVNRGTTHISVMDNIGNTASLSTSNGEGSGLLIPGTGIMMNNMMGEEDLHPNGFHQWPENQRISSMMAPVILNMSDGRIYATGSGGSNRLRTAILQVIVNIVEHHMPLEIAVSSPRIHCEGQTLSMEKGFDPLELAPLLSAWPDNKIWNGSNLFFGGTHSVGFGPEGFEGAGDPRRGGSSLVIY